MRVSHAATDSVEPEQPMGASPGLTTGAATAGGRRGKLASRWRRLARRAMPLTVVTLLAIMLGGFLRYEDPVVLGQLRNIVFDQFQNLSPRPFDPGLPVRVIAIDEASLDRVGQWPWPRARVAELTERLATMGAAAIAFDVILSERDRMSREEIAALVPDGEARAKLLADLAILPDGDGSLAEIFSATPTVVGVVLGGDVEGKEERAGLKADKAGFAFAGDHPGEFVPNFRSVQEPLPELAAAAAGLGALNWLPSRDQVVRTVPLLFHLPDGTFVPSLAAEALRVAQGASTYVIRSSNASGQSAMGERTGVNAVRIGAFEVPTTSDGAILMHYAHATPRRHVPAWRVLEGAVDPAEIEGRIVIVGAVASGLYDLQTTPLDAAVPGVDIHAQVIEHIVTETALERPDWAKGFELVLFAVLAIVFGIVAAWFSPLSTAIIGGTTLAAVFAGTYAAFVREGIFIDPSFPTLGSALSLFLATSWVAVRERADRQWVRHAFGRYVSGDLVKELVTNPDRLTLGGELRPMTILFSDIRSFTTRAEGMNAQELTSYVNAFLTAMTDVIVRNGGTIDKYMGDAIMAFWNAPLDEPRHAARGCEAALQMLDALEEFNRTHAGRYPATAIGVGLNTGVCCVGNLGSSQRFDYSVIGDEVNVGSRLESSTKTYGVPILVGGETAHAAAAEGYVFAHVDDTRVKGKDEEIGIHVLLGGPHHPVAPHVREALPALERLVGAYRAGRVDECRHVLEEPVLRDCAEFAGLVALYRSRLPRDGGPATLELAAE